MVIVTPPSVEPVSLDEVLVHTHADSGPEDSYFTDILVPAARQKAEEYQNRAYLTQTLRLVFDGYPSGSIELPYSPVISVDSVKYYGTDSTEYEIPLTNLDVDVTADPCVINLKYGLTMPSTTLRANSGFQVNYTAGYGATASQVPQKVKLAILFLVGYWYREKGVTDEIPNAFYNLLRPDRLRILERA